MKNDMKKTAIITTVVCLIPVIAGMLLYSRLPDMMVTHWDAQGNPNGWQSKFVAAIVLPGILVIVNLLVPFLLKTDPKYKNLSAKIKSLIQWIIPVICIFCSSLTLAAGLGYNTRIRVLGPMFLGLVFIVIGNYLPKTSQSYTVGIKLPWTLASEENWNRTHRLAGFLWVVCGLLMMLSVLLPGTQYICIGLAVIMLAAPTVYSYLLYRRDKA